jgi:hypothetical protein
MAADKRRQLLKIQASLVVPVFANTADMYGKDEACDDDAAAPDYHEKDKGINVDADHEAEVGAGEDDAAAPDIKKVKNKAVDDDAEDVAEVAPGDKVKDKKTQKRQPKAATKGQRQSTRSAQQNQTQAAGNDNDDNDKETESVDQETNKKKRKQRVA